MYTERKKERIKKMTKKELIEMLNGVKDNEEITFVENLIDGGGFPYDGKVNIYKVIGGKTERITKEYGITRIVKA